MKEKSRWDSGKRWGECKCIQNFVGKPKTLHAM